MTDAVAIPMADLIAFARAEADEVVRRNSTELETRRVEPAVAQRRQQMADGIVAALEALERMGPDKGGRERMAALGLAARPERVPVLYVSVRYGGAYWSDGILNAPVLLRAPAVRQTLLGVIEERMVETIKKGSKTDG